MRVVRVSLIHSWQLLLVALGAVPAIANYIYEGRKR